jgi:hypothetical protein
MITKSPAGDSRCNPSGSWLRLLLLVILALGVLQMHGSGHTTGQPGTGHQAAGHQAAGAEHAAPPMASGPANATDPGEPDRPVDPLAVCLAVLTALGLAAPVLALLAARWAATRDRPADPPAARVRAGRGPPAPVPPLPRRLALQSVLRI